MGTAPSALRGVSRFSSSQLSSLISMRSDTERHDWADGSWVFPRAVRLLGIEAYRKDVLSGILLSIGSKTDSTVR